MRVGVRDSPANKDAECAKYRDELMMRIRDVGEDLLKTCHRFFATVGGLINHLVPVVPHKAVAEVSKIGNL